MSDNTMTTNAFTLRYGDDGIAWLAIDVPGESMNTLQATFVEEVSAILDELESRKDLKGMVLFSAKPDNFVAGADVRMLDACQTAEDAQSIAESGKSCFPASKNCHFTLLLQFMALALVAGWNWRWLATAVWQVMMTKPALACRKSSLVCCLALAVHSVCRA